jgi:F0F1-type ATP synthase epsilon subunit
MSAEQYTPKLTVNARGPFKIYFQGEASAVSATNKVGPFDILPGHADFFSVLSPGDIIIDTEPNPISFYITNGIATVQNDEVLLFVNL